jgi:hypothetical protein
MSTRGAAQRDACDRGALDALPAQDGSVAGLDEHAAPRAGQRHAVGKSRIRDPVEARLQSERPARRGSRPHRLLEPRRLRQGIVGDEAEAARFEHGGGLRRTRACEGGYS